MYGEADVRIAAYVSLLASCFRGRALHDHWKRGSMGPVLDAMEKREITSRESNPAFSCSPERRLVTIFTELLQIHAKKDKNEMKTGRRERGKKCPHI
jgi:hypothetical protein